MLVRLGGNYPSVTYPVLVAEHSGVSSVLCVVHDVPFFGHYEDGDVTVATVWSAEELKAIAQEAQQWDGTIVLSSLETQIDDINQALNDYVRNDLWNWTL